MSAILQRSMRGLLAPGTRKAYCLAGNATLTVRSLSTGQRFTFKIQMPAGVEGSKAKSAPPYFVRLLAGTDNVADYIYLGMIGKDGEFRLTGKSHVSMEAPSVRAISWLVRNWEDARAEVWHEGRCGRCGRVLTVPESIASGIGPTCAGYER